MDPADTSAERTEALRRLAAIGMLTRTFTHEFNNVLGGILGSAQLLAMRHDEPDLRDRLALVVGSVQRGIALTNALSSFARGGPGSPASVDMHVALRKLITDGSLAPEVRLDLLAITPLVAVDADAMRESILAFTDMLAASSSGAAGIATRNRSSASPRSTDATGDAWLEITIAGVRAPTLRERALIADPLASGPGASDLLVAGAAAVVRQSRGRMVVSEEADAPRLHIFLPTA